MEDELTDEVAEHRTANYDITPLLLNRWSPRSMTGETLDEEEYMALFEAARWAPSSYNNQQWRFTYATRNSENWDTFHGLLNDWNQQWAGDAALLICLVAKTTFDYNGEDMRTYMFGAGAAWENLALEATRRGLVAHAMAGFDYEAAAEELNVPDDHEVVCMIAVGKRGPKKQLPDDLQEDEHPNQRRPLDEIALRGGFEAEEE